MCTTLETCTLSQMYWSQDKIGRHIKDAGGSVPHQISSECVPYQFPGLKPQKKNYHYS